MHGWKIHDYSMNYPHVLSANVLLRKGCKPMLERILSWFPPMDFPWWVVSIHTDSGLSQPHCISRARPRHMHAQEKPEREDFLRAAWVALLREVVAPSISNCVWTIHQLKSTWSLGDRRPKTFIHKMPSQIQRSNDGLKARLWSVSNRLVWFIYLFAVLAVSVELKWKRQDMMDGIKQCSMWRDFAALGTLVRMCFPIRVSA